MNFVIIGGDAAGMSAASRAKRKNKELNVIVFEKTYDVSYSACGMPYNIADPARDMDELIVRRAEVFREKQGIDLKVAHEVKKIDPKAKKIYGTSIQGEFEQPFDKLLIATGARPKSLNIPGTELDGVFSLKSLEHGRQIKKYIKEKSVKQAVIIGMGYIALEMCEALRALDIEVSMIKPNPRFLPKIDQELAERIKEMVLSHGVKLYAGSSVNGIERKGEKLLVLSDDFSLDGDMVLIAVGVAPNSELAQDAGLELGVNNAISVDRYFRTSNKDIYAAGDCADTYNVITGKKIYHPLALLANRGGWMVADNIVGKEKEFKGIVATSVFKVFELQVASTGINEKQAQDAGFDPVSVTINSRSRAHAHPGSKTISVHMVADKKTGQLLGTQMVGEEGVAHRINSIAVALHANMSVDEYFGCDLAYAPPFSPVWDPTLTAANVLKKKLGD